MVLATKQMSDALRLRAARSHAGALVCAAAAVGVASPSVALDPWAFAAPASTSDEWAKDLARRGAARERARIDETRRRKETMEDARLRQCEADGARWEDCFFYGTGGEKEGGAAPRAGRGPPTW